MGCAARLGLCEDGADARSKSSQVPPCVRVTRSSVTSDNWDSEFDWPVPLPGGGELVTFRDAGNYIKRMVR